MTEGSAASGQAFNIESIFMPGKWLVLFCGVFVLLWGGLQFVANERLKEEAALVGRQIFSWQWPESNSVCWRSAAQITAADVIARSKNDAVVKVKGTQTISTIPATTSRGAVEQKEAASQAKEETVDCSATLTFYRMSVKEKDYWMLGKVEFP